MMTPRLTPMTFTLGLVAAFVLGVSSYALMSGNPQMSATDMANMAPAAGEANVTASSAPAASQDPADAVVVAKVDGKDITLGQMKEYAKMMPEQVAAAPFDQVFPMVQDQVVMGTIISAKADAAGMAGDAEVQKRLDMLKENVIRATYLEREVGAKTGDDVLKKQYDEFVKSFKPEQEVSAQHILVDSEAKAKEIIKKLEGGAKFEDLVKAESKDKGAGGDGSLGFFKKGDMVKEFAQAAFDMKKGDVSKTPVKTNFGYHVIKVNDTRMSAAPSFDEVKPQLKAQAQRMALEGIIADLRKTAKVELFDMKGNPMPAPQAAAPESTPAAPAAAQGTADTAKPAAEVSPAAGATDAAKPADASKSDAK